MIYLKYQPTTPTLITSNASPAILAFSHVNQLVFGLTGFISIISSFFLLYKINMWYW